MPCMYPPQSYLPLTPPEYLYQHNGCGMQINQHQFAQGFAEKGVYEMNVDPYGRKLMPPTFVRVSQGYHHPQPQSNYAGLPPPGITHPGNQYYAPVGHQRRIDASIVDENFARHQARQQDTRRQEQPGAGVEEKPTGGVSAHLDYEMDEMTDFVGAMAQQLVLGQLTHDKLLPSYRKFVYQILSSTRLPSSTILLGLVYLRERTTLPPSAGSGLRPDNVYRVLTISLLLASKFLDDNTFQNKSWSEVTNIPVQELNALEKEWLRDIKWNLHIDPEGTKGFSQYKNMWEAWVKKKAVTPPLTPIDTNLRARSHSTFSPVVQLFPPHQQSLYTPPHSSIMSDRSIQLPPVRPTQQPTEGAYPWGAWNLADYSPPSAPETGPTTPESHFGGWPYPVQPAPQQSNFSRLPPIVTYNPHPHGWHSHHPGAACCFQYFLRASSSAFL
ncbi:hypothetical protein K440DRAFT_647560 [Wilcoxina mikolae CBS 423.85]|nr:hypothetical protein K440DRAFT_647560 [Wilcoxina mikolae CBS 423.85]